MNLPPKTLIELLQSRASLEESIGYTFLVDGESEEVQVSYRELDRRARIMAAHLQERNLSGQRALILYPPGLDYITAFFGCLYAGVIAVPVYPPDLMRLNRSLPRLGAVARDSGATVALTTPLFLSMADSILGLEEAKDLKNVQWMAIEDLAGGPEQEWKKPDIHANHLAFLQYTSGSTGNPKGVMLSHGNLIDNLSLVQECFNNSSQSHVFSWLPPYHDMGLIGCILQPLYSGHPAVFMSPLDFMKKPLRWLSGISRYRTTHSGGPNFAYDFCARKISEQEKASLDLRSWEVAFNGAEPVRKETMERFSRAFASCGFRKEAFRPCYGLAEATLIVSGLADKSIPASRREEKTPAVSSGKIMPRHQVLIVDPQTLATCDAGQIGEVWVSGQSVAQGYWNRPQETKEVFQAVPSSEQDDNRRFLRTGDLGFLKEGELYITGRLKDVIIIGGKNHYPQDIELTVEKSHPALRPGCGAAFSIEVNGQNRLVVVHEMERRYHEADQSAFLSRRSPDNLIEAFTPDLEKRPDTFEIARSIRIAVAQQHGLPIHAVCLLKAGSIPKTSSGKIQRHACKQGFLENTLQTVAPDSVLKESSTEKTSEVKYA